jgi:hypothetical protein
MNADEEDLPEETREILRILSELSARTAIAYRDHGRFVGVELREWRCKGCGLWKSFPRPVEKEKCGECQRCKGSDFASF